jgi:ferritin-like metal-binding protein YciE
MPHYDFDSVRGSIFLAYLNSAYTSKQHLVAFLPEIQAFVTNTNLKFAIQEFSDDNDLQLVSLDELYFSIEEKFVAKAILGIRVIALEAYKAAISITIDSLERDCAILFCLQSIDSVEIAYFKNLCIMADAFKVNHMNLKYPYDCAVDNLILFNDVYQEIIA